jgi:glycosyltransferase involved in cell wall biosynthesis
MQVSNPTFSIIVPTFYRPEHLARCLRALQTLNYPKAAYEIIVVDDASWGRTAGQVNELSTEGGPPIRYLAQRRGGPAKARNAGARAAAGRYLAFTDDDCEPSPSWLEALERPLRADGRKLVGGLTANALANLNCSKASQLLIDYLYDYYQVEKTGNRFFTTNNIACDAGVFRELGGFDETFPLAAGEDREFCERFQRRGGSMVFAEDAKVMHWHDLNLRRFAKQHFNYGRGADFLHRSRWAAMQASGNVVHPWRPKLERPSFYVNLVLYPFKRERGVAAWRLAALMGMSQMAYASGYVYQRVQHTKARE